MNEAQVQQRIRLNSSKHGTPLLRNNNGACFDAKENRMIRYGLGNVSKKINDKFKSSDLIGIYPQIITPEMVGYTIGRFFAIECKPPGWVFRESDKRAVAQKNFGDWVIRHGGIFKFATHEDDPWTW